jgi:sulfur transfer protein SufE
MWGGLEAERWLDPPVLMPNLEAFSHVAERTGQDLGSGKKLDLLTDTGCRAMQHTKACDSKLYFVDQKTGQRLNAPLENAFQA